MLIFLLKPKTKPNWYHELILPLSLKSSWIDKQKIQSRIRGKLSTKFWNLQRFKLAMEYYRKLPNFPPNFA
jgi:hypothetical protein